MNKQTVKDLQLKNKKVLMRADFNVPLKDGEITNDNRIQAALPTIKHILDEGGKLIVFSHLGRVKEEADKNKLSMAPVAKRLGELLDQEVTFINETRLTSFRSSYRRIGTRTCFNVREHTIRRCSRQKRKQK